MSGGGVRIKFMKEGCAYVICCLECEYEPNSVSVGEKNGRERRVWTVRRSSRTPTQNWYQLLQKSLCSTTVSNEVVCLSVIPSPSGP